MILWYCDNLKYFSMKYWSYFKSFTIHRSKKFFIYFVLQKWIFAISALFIQLSFLKE